MVATVTTTSVDAVEDAREAPSVGTPPRGRLAAPGAVLLVSCYELGHQPLSLAGPLAELRRAGFAPVAVDTAVEDLGEDAVRAARLVAISVPMHTALRLGARVAARVRSLNPAAHVCFYGLYATLNADHLLREHGDSAISGEVVAPLLALARALDRGEGFEGIPGVGTARVPAAPVLGRGGTLVPDRAGLPPLRSYAGLERDGVIVPAGYVEATRGCHHTCRHCPITPIYGGRLTVVPRETVLADARAQVAAGARHITFGDPDFLNGPAHALRIARALHEEFPGLTFDATVKVEHVLQHRRVFPELAALGCAFVVSAVESLSDEVLLRLAKGHTREDVVAALDVLDSAGIPMRPSLLPFTPWETLDGYLDLLRFVAERDLSGHVDPVMLAIRLLVPPGSALLSEPGADAWLGDLDAERFTYRWAHPDPRMDALHAEVSAIVEGATVRDESQPATFVRIWDAAHRAAGHPESPFPSPSVNRRPPPRLTESWFC
ncbi:MAG: Radical SAM domain protein [uncultured Thermomicrobiales bacterium]|uniref:Radical SAM domain protein n=1 Tax=uncultured Thermomicrobiales bacterium TaxID=1645740 RepID=A0A6J4UN22_9BACT|nr:MAG: Radical SAM domain protein [uncultured Thermomicrobiales bacterium]